MPVRIKNLGRWWGTNSKEKREEEIDLVGESLDGNAALFCECKYQAKLVDIAVLEALEEKSTLFKHYRARYYMLFAKKGFTKRLQEEAAGMGNVRLVGLHEMYQDPLDK
jgi:hypothetical protein